MRLNLNKLLIVPMVLGLALNVGCNLGGKDKKNEKAKVADHGDANCGSGMVKQIESIKLMNQIDVAELPNGSYVFDRGEFAELPSGDAARYQAQITFNDDNEMSPKAVCRYKNPTTQDSHFLGSFDLSISGLNKDAIVDVETIPFTVSGSIGEKFEIKEESSIWQEYSGETRGSFTKSDISPVVTEFLGYRFFAVSDTELVALKEVATPTGKLVYISHLIFVDASSSVTGKWDSSNTYNTTTVDVTTVTAADANCQPTFDRINRVLEQQILTDTAIEDYNNRQYNSLGEDAIKKAKKLVEDLQSLLTVFPSNDTCFYESGEAYVFKTNEDSNYFRQMQIDYMQVIVDLQVALIE
jgi:hypothetical protein